MNTDQIKIQRTYKSKGGGLYYVQDICGSKVTYSPVGSTDRAEASMRRFASRMDEEVPNQ